MQAKQEQAMQAQQMQSLTEQAGQLARAPMMDPSKNPEALDAINAASGATPQQ